VEQGKQAVARQEWKILAKQMNQAEANRDLALRKPHLRHVQAQIAAAKTRLEAAKLDEARTSIYAPFTGIFLEEDVEQGQFIGRQSALATLVSTEAFWVQVAVPLFLLERMHFPEQEAEQEGVPGSRVEIILERGQGSSSVIRQGTVFKLLADLDPKGRMARILVSLPDPLCLDQETAEATCSPQEAILLGSFVRVRMEAGQLEQIFVLPEKALREDNRLWVVNGDGVLSFRDAQVRWRRVGEVLVEAEIAPDERIVISRLQSPIPGMKVREEAGKDEGNRKTRYPFPL
jgi:multidrug efflux pump subunit AcrA (membrane-fusion protein)